jgi:hypothetical protein
VLQGFSPLKSLLALVGIGTRPVLADAGRARAGSLLRALHGLCGRQIPRHRRRIPVARSRTCRARRQLDRGRLSGAAAGRAQQQAKSASQWLSGEIESLRKKVARAESRVEDFRSKSSLFVGTNNTTLSNQQMGEINTQLNNARALKSDAESKARLIKEMLQSGKPIEASEVLNSETIRRCPTAGDVRAQLAEQSSTLLDGHPRIKELKAQLADLDRQLREEARQGVRARWRMTRALPAAGRRPVASLDQLKKQASSNNGQDVQLARSSARPRRSAICWNPISPSIARRTRARNIEAAPADGRIISRATVSNTPAYPKKLPIVLIATLATLLLTSGAIATGELLRMTAPRARLRLRRSWRECAEIAWLLRSRCAHRDRARASRVRRR